MRRIFMATLVCALALLTACSKSSTAFSGVDLTGADFGRDFRLQDGDGRTRTLADFRGKYVMIFFGYTQCPDVCPTALARAVAVRKQLGADADRLQVIFVSVDPERDSANVLKAYTAAFDPGFIGLVPTGGSYAMDHTAITYILDPKGRLRLGMRHSQSADEYVADLRTLMKIDSI